MIANDCVKVTKERVNAQGDNTGWYRHAYDDVDDLQCDGVFELALSDGSPVLAGTKTNAPYFRQSGAEQDVIGAKDFECAFMEVELFEPPAF